jgi:hypothetical protein
MNNLLWYHLGKKLGGGGSGGGGAFPPGAYWKVPWRFPVGYESAHFLFGGELYSFNQYTSDNSSIEINKYENGVYTKVAGFSYSYPCSPSYVSFAEMNGKMHFLGADRGMHYVWDGVSASCTKMADVPYSLGAKQAVVYNNTLYVLCNRSYGLHKWNESGDTWTKVATITSGTSCVALYNGELLVWQQDKKLYKYNFESKTSTLLKTFDLFTGNSQCAYWSVIGDFMYFCKGEPYNQTGVLYKYNLETDESIEVGGMPYAGVSSGSFEYNGRYHIGSGSNTYRTIYELYDIDPPAEA